MLQLLIQVMIFLMIHHHVQHDTFAIVLCLSIVIQMSFVTTILFAILVPEWKVTQKKERSKWNVSDSEV